MSDSTSGEIVVLRQQFSQVLTSMSDLTGELRTLRNELHQSNLNIAKLQTEVQLRACPSPGSCLTLGPKVDNINDRLQEFENQAQQVKGAKKMMILVVALCSAFGGAIGAKTIKALDSVTSAVTSK